MLSLVCICLLLSLLPFPKPAPAGKKLEAVESQVSSSGRLGRFMTGPSSKKGGCKGWAALSCVVCYIPRFVALEPWASAAPSPIPTLSLPARLLTFLQRMASWRLWCATLRGWRRSRSRACPRRWEGGGHAGGRVGPSCCQLHQLLVHLAAMVKPPPLFYCAAVPPCCWATCRSSRSSYSTDAAAAAASTRREQRAERQQRRQAAAAPCRWRAAE